MKAEDNNRMEVLAFIIADQKAENMMLTERVHQLTDDYNDVARQLKEKHEPNTEGHTLGEPAEALEKDNKLLKQQCVQLQTERDEAKTHVAGSNKMTKQEKFDKQMQEFNQKAYQEIQQLKKFLAICDKDQEENNNIYNEKLSQLDESHQRALLEVNIDFKKKKNKLKIKYKTRNIDIERRRQELFMLYKKKQPDE